jgi:Mg2+ and Co2+ transporter CorA
VLLLSNVTIAHPIYNRFVQAGHSRDSLRVTRELFTNILTYRQVMPSFLDFVFSFGKQQHAEDFHFSGFRGEFCLSSTSQNLRIPELGRSGKNLQLCYSLRSVEPAPLEPVPWSIRQTAFYHSFDVESGQASWIIIKGNDCMKNRVMLETQGPNGPDLRCFDTINQCFSSALATHLLFCEWSAENWRWYINRLEEKVQDITRRTLDKSIYAPGTSGVAVGGSTRESNTSIKSVKRSWSFKAPSRTLTFERFNVPEEPKAPRFFNESSPKPNGRPPPPVLPPGVKSETQGAPNDASATQYQPEPFQFDEVRRIQLIEERANETLLILKTNTTVQEELKHYYSSLAKTNDIPQEIKELCGSDLTDFCKRINSLQNDFRMQQARLETLLRLLADRKTLLYGILDYQNMQASKALAEKGQQSAESMENVTLQMHEIAVQTKQETVSMKIITLVTLFFLPGTFISVCEQCEIILNSLLIS